MTNEELTNEEHEKEHAGECCLCAATLAAVMRRAEAAESDWQKSETERDALKAHRETDLDHLEELARINFALKERWIEESAAKDEKIDALKAELAKAKARIERQRELMRADPEATMAAIAKFVTDPAFRVDMLEVMECGHVLANMDEKRDVCLFCEAVNAQSKTIEAARHLAYEIEGGNRWPVEWDEDMRIMPALAAFKKLSPIPEWERDGAGFKRAALPAKEAKLSEEQEAYNRAFHCGAGGHDGHPEGVIQKDSAWQAYDDRCCLAVAWKREQKENAALRAEVERMREALSRAPEPQPKENAENFIRDYWVWLLHVRATALTPTSPGLPEGEKDEPCGPCQEDETDLCGCSCHKPAAPKEK